MHRVHGLERQCRAHDAHRFVPPAQDGAKFLLVGGVKNLVQGSQGICFRPIEQKILVADGFDYVKGLKSVIGIGEVHSWFLSLKHVQLFAGFDHALRKGFRIV
jgi:hypothetical protein